MRTLILSMQVSLDGYIEGPRGDMSWIEKDDDELWKDLFGMLQSVDLFLLGGGMFADYRNYWKQALHNPTASHNEVAYARLAEKRKHIVFSSTIKDPKWDNTQIVNGNVEEEIKKLKQELGQDIQVVGGARLASTVIAAGLVDEYRLTINPIIIGSGKSFFKDQWARHSLRHISTKVLNNGIMVVRYRAK
jgi:dihydrofolate reductase